MPHDLGLEEGPVPISESPHSKEENEEQQANGRFVIFTDQQLHTSSHPVSIGRLYPYTSLLTISDLESCVALENAAFPIEQERASRDKVSKPILHLWTAQTLSCLQYAGLPPFLKVLWLSLQKGPSH